jgi:hypothetical protein
VQEICNPHDTSKPKEIEMQTLLENLNTIENNEGATILWFDKYLK